MKTNGTVHHLEGIPSGYKRSWEANCLLCEWLSRKGACVRLEERCESRHSEAPARYSRFEIGGATG